MSVDQAIIEVAHRAEKGKGAARRLRRLNRIPGVVYGKGKEPASISLDAEILRRALKTAHGLNTVLTLKIDNGTQRLALLKDWETEVTTSRLIHADFVEISLDKPVRVEVPVHVTGKCKGVTDGGILEIIRHVLVVDALPANIPTAITIDVTDLGLNHSIHVSDLKFADGVKHASSTNYAIVSVAAPRSEKVEEAAAAAPGAEGAPAADAKAADGKAAAPAKDAKGAAPAKDAKAAAPAKK
jgi:large subunit ribosomal protein L25